MSTVLRTDRDEAPAVDSAGSRSHARIASACGFGFAAVLFYLAASSVPGITGGEALSVEAAWVRSLGVAFAFRLDGLSLLFVLLISGIGALIVPYTAFYLHDHPHLARLQWLLLGFMLSMLGLVTADDVVLLFVFWELTTITSFLLVGFDHESAKARRAAVQALLVTGGGGLAMLAGLLVLGDIAGASTLSGILASDVDVTAHAAYPVVLGLVLLGAFTKSAQFPFHFWLPGAMAAPTPVSAFLHSATMVKGGVYLMARLQPGLGGTDLWFHTLTLVGAVTAIWASLMALRQTDLKTMLAWTTVMALGTLTLFLGSAEPIAAVAAMTFLVVHALYKCALFLVVGNVDHATGTREVTRLGALARVLPLTALAGIAAAFSMAGFPPFLGFIGKELKYEGALAIAGEPWPYASAAVAANAMMVAVALIVVLSVFLRGRDRLESVSRDAPHGPPGEAPGLLGAVSWIAPSVLAAAGLLAGLFPEYVGRLVAPAATAITGEPTPVKLSLWHGINLPLMMSVVTVLIGIALYLLRVRLRHALDRGVAAIGIDGDTAYDASLDALSRGARTLASRLQTGRLGSYLTVVFATFLIAGALVLVRTGVIAFGLDEGASRWRLDRLTAVTPFAALVVVLIAAATGVVAFASSRLLCIAALGVVGAGVALIFLQFGAIDVAITQLMVETLFVVLIAAVLPRLPRFLGVAHPGRAGSQRDALLAAGTGLVVGGATFIVATLPAERTITRFYEAASLSEAYGRNIVNVILVDFRALDTLGEVAVVVAATLAVAGLLGTRFRRGRTEPAGPNEIDSAPVDSPDTSSGPAGRMA